jgi:peptidyl-prolyl cis-trans isomerase SurA
LISVAKSSLNVFLTIIVNDGANLIQKLFHIISPGFLLFFLLVSPSHGEHLVDRVVAVVNDDVITLAELEKAGKEFFERIKAQAPANERERALEKARAEVLSSLIDKFIVRQQAEKLSITVAEKELDAAIDQILVRNNATIKDFRGELAEMNISEPEYRDNLRDQILKSKLIGYEVRSRIVIIEEDIQTYYQKEYTLEKGEGGYYILQMGFTWRNTVVLEKAGFDTKEAARAKAEEVRLKVVAGESFRELAKAYSNLPSAADGGDIGLFKKDEMAPYMKDVIMAMLPGEISPIVETGNAFQFFKLLSTREGDIVVKAPYESVREEIRNILYRQEMEEQYEIWVKSLREKAYIKILL